MRYLLTLFAVFLLLGEHPLAAQDLRELEIKEIPAPIGGDVFPDYPDKAAVSITSTLQTLRFRSSLGLVAEISEPQSGRYRLILEPRPQILFVWAEGYRETQIQIPALETREVRYYDIQPKGQEFVAGTGTLIIETEPSDARITSVNGVPADLRTPHPFRDVPAQALRLIIEKEEYETMDTVLVVEAGAVLTQRLRLSPTFGYVRLITEPESQLHVDGNDTPFINGELIKLPVGEYALALRKLYHVDFDTTITVQPGAVVTLNRPLPRLRAQLRVTSSPDGAGVQLNGQAAGATPLETMVDTGRPYVVSVQREGYLPEARELFADSAGLDEQVFLLTPFTARSEDDAVQFAYVRLDREESAVVITYRLDSEADEKYKVTLTLFDQAGRSVKLTAGTLLGQVGKNMEVDTERRIVWQPPDPLPPNGRVELTVDEQGGSGLLYVLGGVAALAVGGGAAVLFGGGGGNGDGNGNGGPTPTQSLPLPPLRPGGQ